VDASSPAQDKGLDRPGRKILGVGHETASNLSVHFSISHMGISAATFKAAEPMVRKKAFGMKTPYS
jgi:hypothetical protein